MAGKEKLTARAAATSKPGRHGDGRGLYLIVSETGARKWVFRFTSGGKVTEMGLGSADNVTLAEVRAKADAARKLVAAGVNPIEAKREADKAIAAKPTFGQFADDLVTVLLPSFRNEKHKYQWSRTLEVYAASLRAKAIDEISTEDILEVLLPIWTTKSETAARLRGRIERVLDAAKAKGLRSGENPARWRGHFDKLLPKRQKLTRGHHAALPYPNIPEFIGKLREREAPAAFALEFTILTAARSGEVLGAQWPEIDLAGKVWTIPAARMKAGREHRVPLSGRALAILQKLVEVKTGDLIFAGQRPGKPLSGMAMAMLLRRMGSDVSTHGFRSSFRDWAGEETHFPREIAEAALAHMVGDEVERAYRRGDALEKRRAMMEAWSAFCEPRAGSNVVPMTRRTDAVAS